MTADLQQVNRREIEIETQRAAIKGHLNLPSNPLGIVIFAHGAGSSRLSPRNQHVAEILNNAGFATLLMDLLSEEEERIDIFTGRLRFDIPFLAGRVDSATLWVMDNKTTAKLPIGYFGASTGAAAALVASIQRPQTIAAIVSRGGRPGLADTILPEIKSPTMLIVGSEDNAVLEENQISLGKINTEKKLIIIPGATHLFEEPGKLDEVANHAKKWFQKYLGSQPESKSKNPGSHIDSCSFGHITVDEIEYDEDLIVFPDEIKSHWWRKQSHQLVTDDLNDVIRYRPDLLIVGTGQSGQMNIDPALKDDLLKQGIELVEAPTEQAVKMFNTEIEKKNRVVGAFHLTC